MYLNAIDDNDSPNIVSVNPDNSDGPFGYNWSLFDSRLGSASNIFVSPVERCLYVPVPAVTPYSTFGGNTSQPYTVLRMPINPDGTVGTVTTAAGVLGGHGIPSNHSGFTPNDQG